VLCPLDAKLPSDGSTIFTGARHVFFSLAEFLAFAVQGSNEKAHCRKGSELGLQIRVSGD